MRTAVQKKLWQYWEELEGRSRGGGVYREMLRTLSEDGAVRSVFRDKGLPLPCVAR